MQVKMTEFYFILSFFISLSECHIHYLLYPFKEVKI